MIRPTVSFSSLLLLAFSVNAAAAPPDRILSPVDTRQVRAVAGNVHRLATAQFDRGEADADMPMNYMMLMVKPSAAQQAELDRLLAEQQNPASPLYHQWLSPEEFGNRFGLSLADLAKVAEWLRSEGFTVNETARGRNWIAFSGKAGQVARALHTAIHRFQVDGETHFANTSEPSVPAALADVVAGFAGLNDFYPKPFARLVDPDYNLGTSHYLTPADFTTIYDLTPLYQAGTSGSGQGIAIVGQSDVLLSDLRAFRSRYGLPASDPQMIAYAGTDPGFNGAQVEGNLDLEWAGAIAPNATLYYVYGPSAITAIVSAVNLNVAPIVSISYGGCEINFSQVFYRSVAQQGNAQGITILSASGDSGAAGCDTQGSEPLATRGRMVDFPAVMPEVTGVGGTQFVEGTGTFWSPGNSPTFGSALSYIPEAVWNESSTTGLGASGGGASLLYSKPAWQAGPGVPKDNARDVPDVALSAAGHDAYFITYSGVNLGIAGTSASAPSMAGIVALLNQYQVTNGYQKQPGLGNINPQLYRLAQTAPTAFHDVTSGDNIVTCSQGSPDCLTGSFGYAAGPGYDMATGLGSIDATVLVTKWNSQAAGVTVTLTASPAQVTVNDSVTANATVAPAAGSGTPAGNVSFSVNGIALGSAALSGGTASLTFPVAQLGTGFYLLSAVYSGDGTFSGGGAEKTFQITLPSKGAAVVLSGPNTVPANPADAQGLSWQTQLTLRELAGVATLVTGFTIDGVAQPLAQYFPAPAIAPSGSLSTTVVFRNLATPLVRTFAVTGVDATGQNWTRQIAVNYFSLPLNPNFKLTATPMVVTQNKAADPSCQWAVQLNVDDLGGFLTLMSSLRAGNVDLTPQISAVFGTERIDAWGGQQGTLCFSGITPPATNTVSVTLSGFTQQTNIAFAGPPASPATLSAAPATLSLAAGASQPAQGTLTVTVSDATQPWTASIFPANRTTAWLSASQLSGTGPAQIALTANGTGFEPGAYRATIVIQSPNAVPQTVSVPVMFVLGGSSSTSIAAVVSPATYLPAGSPGMLVSVFGTNLANAPQLATGSPLPYSTAGVTATVNGLPAPLLYVSQNQLNLQVPYAAGAGPAVLGVNNNGQVAGFQFQMAPAAPGVFADSSGNLLPNLPVAQGGIATLYVTGVGEVTPALKTAYSLPTGIPVASLPRPVLPLSVTVGGVQAFVQFAGIAPGLIGGAQVNFTVPASVPVGVQPVVVTVDGVASRPVNLTVTPAGP